MHQVFRALSDPTRRKMLELLRERDMNASEIADQFEMTKPSISHHLDLLRQAGLVVTEKQGQFVIYSLSTSVIEDLMQWLMTFSSPHPNPEQDEKVD